MSAHTIPADDGWLETLVAPLADPGRLAVYGAQIYPLTSRFLDKRDLDIFSDPNPREETEDTDFWNANSAFSRATWERMPFEEDVFELEDHYWTKRQLPSPGLAVGFEPAAPVYHYGHEERNDRTFLPPDRPSDSELIARSIDVLDSEQASWPEVMSAGLSLGSLSHLPEVRGAVPAMGRRLLGDPDFDVRWRMAHALGRIGASEAVPYLVAGLRDRSFYARDEVAWALARLGPVAVPDVIAELDRLDGIVLPFAGLALGMSGDPDAEVRARGLMADCMASGDIGVERDAVYFAGELAATPGAETLLGDVAARLHGPAARGAAWSWGMLAVRTDRADPSAVREFATDHPEPSVRAEAVIALGRLGRARPPAKLDGVVAHALSDRSGAVRYAAMQSLRLAALDGSGEAAEIAREHDGDSDFGVRFEHALVTGRQVHFG